MRRIITMALALIMLFSLCAVSVSADSTNVYSSVYAVFNGQGSYCQPGDSNAMQLSISGSTALVSYKGSSEICSITNTPDGFAISYAGNLLTGCEKDGCIILSGKINGVDCIFMLALESYAAGEPAGSNSIVIGDNKTSSEIIAEAASQGISIPADFTIGNPKGTFVSFYSTDRDNSCRCKSKAEASTASTIKWIPFPFNAYLYGSYGSCYLIKTVEGNYYFIPSSVVGYCEITGNPGTARRGEGLVTMIEAQGITVPSDFYFSDVKVGEIRNNSGGETYALYKFYDPYHNTKEFSYGLLYYYCSADSRTWSYDAKVTIYGYYGGRVLYQTKAGEFFWATATDFFKAA